VNKRTDISQQIRKYLNGELDGRAMHQLEKEALNDPFLMEALEGYEKAGAGQQNNIDDIHARLKARIDKKGARVIPWRIISIAASILIALTIGGIWLKNDRPETAHKKIALANTTKLAKPDTKPIELAKVTPPARHKSPVRVSGPAPQQKQPEAIVAAVAPPSAQYNASAPPAANGYLAATPAPKKDILIDTSKLDEVVVLGYAAKRKTSVTGSVATVTAANLDTKDKSQTTVTQLYSKVAGVQMTSAPNNTVFGIVRGKDDGLPIPGVSVQIKGTDIAALTDVAGRFKLNSVPKGAVLNFKYIGYAAQEVPLTKKQDSLVIAMQPNNQALSEVVVVGYGEKKEQEYQPALPAAGWSDYNKYLKNNAISPDGKTGTVKLSFIVNTDNSLSDFTIIKSVSPKTDSTAIALIQHGPVWNRSTDNKPKKIRLKINFKGGK